MYFTYAETTEVHGKIINKSKHVPFLLFVVTDVYFVLSRLLCARAERSTCGPAGEGDRTEDDRRASSVAKRW